MELKIVETKTRVGLSQESIRAKLSELHEKESSISNDMTCIDKNIRDLLIKKRKLAKRMSANVLYRNKLIGFLNNAEMLPIKLT